MRSIEQRGDEIQDDSTENAIYWERTETTEIDFEEASVTSCSILF